MDEFSISDLARYSGIKPHTIRIWEKRYGALQPNRSSGNTRYYDAQQLKRLLNISGLLNSDYKVSELCAMSDKHLTDLNRNLIHGDSPAPAEYFISQLVAAALTYNESQFAQVFSHCLLRYGLKNAYLEVLYPVMVRIGLMWLTDSMPTANEHFISNLIRQKLFTAIDSLPPPKLGSPSWLLFLPENEFHELGLLMAWYLIRQSGQKVIYLGGNLPGLSLRAAVNEIMPDYLLLFLVHRDQTKRIQNYLDMLNEDLEVEKIFVSTSPGLIQKLKTAQKVQFLETAGDLDKQLEIEYV